METGGSKTGNRKWTNEEIFQHWEDPRMWPYHVGAIPMEQVEGKVDMIKQLTILSHHQEAKKLNEQLLQEVRDQLDMLRIEQKGLLREKQSRIVADSGPELAEEPGRIVADSGSELAEELGLIVEAELPVRCLFYRTIHITAWGSCFASIQDRKT